MGQQDGSAGKGACPKPYNLREASHGGREEPILRLSYSLWEARPLAYVCHHLWPQRQPPQYFISKYNETALWENAHTAFITCRATKVLARA